MYFLLDNPHPMNEELEKKWNEPDKDGNINVPDYLDALTNKVGFQIRFHTISGKNEIQTICDIVYLAEKFFTDLATTQQAERVKELETALNELESIFSNEYKGRCEQADWYNNNMPRVGQTIDYMSRPPKPKVLEVIDNALNKSI